MKSRFGYLLSPALRFLIYLFMLVCAGSILYGFLRMFGAFGLVSPSLTLEISAIVLSALFLTLLIFTLTARYVLADGRLKLKLGFWDVTGGKFKIESIIKIVKATNLDKLYVNLYVNGEPHIMLVNIPSSDFKAFTDGMKSLNTKILYEEAEIS